jgi:L-fuconolactonase
MSIFSRVHAPRQEWLARAEPEEALEPQLPIVDTHLHLWHFNGDRYFVEEYARDVAACGHNIEASVYVECSNMYRATGPEHLKCVGETEFALGQAAMGASHKYTSSKVAQAIVSHADLLLGERVREVLQAHVAAGNGRFRGIRFRAKWDADPAVSNSQWNAPGPGLYLRPEFGKGLDVLTSMGLVFEASVYHPQLPDVTALARAHPETRIAVVHSGSPVGHSSYAGKDRENHARWLADMRELATCPNVSMKLGGLVLHLGLFDFTTEPAPPSSRRLADLWRPWIEPCIELFGAERCMVQANFPVDKAGFGYRTAWNMFKHITAGCSADEKQALYSGTARRFYKIN